jgi:hypothetical protein
MCNKKVTSMSLLKNQGRKGLLIYYEYPIKRISNSSYILDDVNE